MKCTCCGNVNPIIARGLCRRCYTNVVDKNKNRFSIEYIGSIYKIHDKINKEPLTEEEVKALFKSIECGAFGMLPIGFWNSPYLESNVKLCLKYLFRDVYKVSRDEINDVHHRRLVSNSCLSHLLSKGMVYIRGLLSDVYKVEVV